MNEVDLIIDTGYRPVPVEIKSSRNFKDSFFKGIEFFRKISNKHKLGGLIYNGKSTCSTDKAIIYSYYNVYDL